MPKTEFEVHKAQFNRLDKQKFSEQALKIIEHSEETIKELLKGHNEICPQTLIIINNLQSIVKSIIYDRQDEILRDMNKNN